MSDDRDLRAQAIERLEMLAELSGWESAVRALDSIIKVDAFLQTRGPKH